jgi:hypothetical protein
MGESGFGGGPGPFSPGANRVSLTPDNAQFCTIMHQKAKREKAVWSRKTRYFPRFAAMKKEARIASVDRCSIQLS